MIRADGNIVRCVATSNSKSNSNSNPTMLTLQHSFHARCSEKRLVFNWWLFNSRMHLANQAMDKNKQSNSHDNKERVHNAKEKQTLLLQPVDKDNMVITSATMAKRRKKMKGTMKEKMKKKQQKRKKSHWIACM